MKTEKAELITIRLEHTLDAECDKCEGVCMEMKTEIKTQHTPSPFRVGDAGHTIFGPPNGNPSPKTVAQGLSKEDSAYIVKCVNSHQELLSLVKRLNQAFYVNGTRNALLPVMQETKAAIAKAEEK